MDLDMFAEYIQAALERAEYEIIDDSEPYYAHVPGLPGMWATGKTSEECRKGLISVIEGWIVLVPFHKKFTRFSISFILLSS
jgi:predicted RNase H-like HicB family nuclease